MSDVIRQVMIRGRVQGVGYRAWVAHVASVLDVEGWVRNRRNGSVEAVFAGPSAVVAEMVARCRRGPSAAQVAAVEDEPVGADALKSRAPDERFSVLPTL
jgi:acylphosphatase